MLNIILLGPPGAGKGTQAKDLVQRLNLKHLSTGDILREEKEKKTDLGIQIQKYMNQGLLVPNEVVLELLRKKLESLRTDCEGFIFDGYPRNIQQAENLETLLAEMGMQIDMVIFFDVTEEISVQRLSGRRVCSKCGANFHITNMPPKQEGICDYCGGSLYQRDDDTPEVIKKRWATYMEETLPLLNYYEKKGLLYRIDATKPKEEAFRDLVNLIRKFKK